MMHLSELIDTGHLINYCLDPAHEDSFASEQCLVNGNRIETKAPGILTIEPDGDTSGSILISCGVHGNETAPIELTEQLFCDIISGSLVPRCRMMIILGNLPAMRINKRFCEENLNRLFKQEAATHQNVETTRASEIMVQVDRFFDANDSEVRIHLDLHTAIRGSKYEKFAIYPHQADGNWQRPVMSWLSSASIEAILLANKPSGTFSCYTNSVHDALGFTVELGKARPFGSNDHSRLQQFKSALSELLTKPELVISNQSTLDCIVFNVVAEVLKHSDAFQLNLSDDFENFSDIENGYKLTNDGDNSYYINGDDKAVVFPNKNVPVGQRVALIVEPYQK